MKIPPPEGEQLKFKRLKFHTAVALALTAAPLALILPTVNAYAAQLEEIVVTAERRTASLQDVPIAVTAFSSEGIEQLKIEDFGDLALKIPGFSVQSFSKTRTNPALRGGGSSLNSAGAEQAVGLFVDDVYFGGAGDFEMELFDVNRIEVLRGPQGTLFGRNTTGGLINVITKDPGQERESKVQASVGNYDLRKLGAYFAAPINDKLAASIAVSSTDRSGTSFNTVTNNDVDTINRSAARGKLVWTPADDLEVKFALGYSTKDETGIARDAVGPTSGRAPDHTLLRNFVPDGDTRTVQQYTDGGYESEQWVSSLHISKNVNNITFQSITTARKFDADGERVSLAGVTVPIFSAGEDRDLEAYTQEFRLISNADSKLQWQAGAFYLNSDEQRDLDAITNWDVATLGAGPQGELGGCPDPEDPFGCAVLLPELFTPNEFQLHENVKTESFSLYAQGTYDFSDQWGVTLGGRYTKDEKELSGDTEGDFDFFWNPTPGRIIGPVSNSWDEFTWKASVDFKPTDDVLLYASASTGFRSGVYDIATSNPAQADRALNPETVLSYEIGAKTRFIDDRIQVNVAIFDVTYEDLQFFAVATDGSNSLSTNVGEASVNGIELDIAYAVTDELVFSLGYSNQDGDSQDIPTDIPEGTPPQGTVPESLTMALDYTKGFKGGEFYAHIDYLKKDEYTLEFSDNTIPGFRSEVEGQVNANIGYRWENGLSIQVWGKNLTDEDVVIYGQDFFFALYGANSLGDSSIFDASFGPRYDDPRTYGVTVSYDF